MINQDLLNKVFTKKEASYIYSIFDSIEYAEQEIATMKAKYPKHAEEINECFRYMQPGILLGKPDKLYRSHCREIIMRVIGINSEKLEIGTDAEVICILSETSLKAPLTQSATYLYNKLFIKVMGFDPTPEITLYEPWEGASNELENSIRNTIAKDIGKNRDCRS